MGYIRFVELYTLALFLGMLLFLEAGRRSASGGVRQPLRARRRVGSSKVQSSACWGYSWPLPSRELPQASTPGGS
jgi:hypothetical protein